MNGQALIFGMGQSGQSVARYFTRIGRPFRAADTRRDEGLAQRWRTAFPGVEIALGDCPASLLDGVDELIVSPGLAMTEPLIQTAQARGIPVVGDMALALRDNQRPVVMITGSNGKSTVTALVGALLQSLGIRAGVGGNFGTPALDLLLDAPEILVLEVSSFQLETMQLADYAPTAATVLNVSQDHLDRHGTMAVYAGLKARVLRHAATAVINADDPWVAAMPSAAGARRVAFTLGAPAQPVDFGRIFTQGGWWLAQGAQPILPVDALGIHGSHNQANALAALALVQGVLPSVALDDPRLIETLRRFSGLPHRAQTVGVVGGVQFIDDSKATNVGAAVAAIRGIEAPLVLIAGGQGKGQDFTPLAEALRERAVAAVLLGQDQAAVAAALTRVLGEGFTQIRVQTLSAAVAAAAQWAPAGGVVLLAPACASLDMFANYQDRGRQFAQAVAALTAREATA
ncbi:UDP-N-acetylmuramoyl-L-alanine--D-glutamate ligase [Halothiobacillus sp. DCM-1]|uniref:UDP-N-acetylmuramoyl-L-alanine--D-glutamate ligase n=1 Tax=Halothiobacillus sp. DCM-1 TaxID=3112558 RepID=UPI003255924E